jgi:hypothetical protein
MPLALHLTRDSVAAGDDADAPHDRLCEADVDLAAEGNLARLIRLVLETGYLPSVAGPASGAAFSHFPLAVISNIQPALSVMWLTESEIRERLDWRGGRLRIHFAYLAGAEPKLAFDILRSSLSAWRR